MHQPGDHLLWRLIDRPWAALAAAAVLALCAWPLAARLEFDRSIENMFAPGDPLLPPFQQLKRTFGGDEVVLCVYPDDHLLDADGAGIRRLRDVRERIERAPGVRAALSLDRLSLGDRPEDIVDPDSDVSRRLRELFAGYTHSSDGTVAAVVCLLTPLAADGPSRRETVAALRAAIEEVPGGMVAGEPVMIVDGFRYLEDDGRRLGWISTLLVSLVVVACFRSLRWLVLPLLVVQLALLSTQALLVLGGLQLSMVSSMLTAIITVIGVAAVVHVIVRYREARGRGAEPRDALRAAAVLLAAPVFWSCVTDAAGFLSLLSAEVGPVRDFGMMMALGALLVLPSIVLVTPAATLFRADREVVPPASYARRQPLGRFLFWLVTAIERRGRAIALVAGALAVLAAAAVTQLEVESDFTKNFRRDSPVVASYAFVEERLGGAGVFDVLLPAPERLDWEYIDRVRKLEQRLRDEVQVVGADGVARRGLTKVISLADAVVAGSPLDPGDLPLAALRNAAVTGGVRSMRERLPAFVDALYAQDPADQRYWFRIMLRSHERQTSAEKQQIIRQVSRVSRESFGEARVTGLFVLLARLIDSMLRDQWVTFGVATVGITLVLAAAFRSVTIALAALVPNVLPIVAVLGLLGAARLAGFADLKLNMGAAMIAAVSLGLSVDSSIHYISAWRRAREAGGTRHEALLAAHQTAGRAMIFSTLALLFGFAALAASQFVPTIYFGVLVSLAMLGGLVGNLVILPLLLSWLDRTPAAASET